MAALRQRPIKIEAASAPTRKRIAQHMATTTSATPTGKASSTPNSCSLESWTPVHPEAAG